MGELWQFFEYQIHCNNSSMWSFDYKNKAGQGMSLLLTDTQLQHYVHFPANKQKRDNFVSFNTLWRELIPFASWIFNTCNHVLVPILLSSVLISSYLDYCNSSILCLFSGPYVSSTSESYNVFKIVQLVLSLTLADSALKHCIGVLWSIHQSSKQLP